MKDKYLDFIIIGAQKSGTTSLHKYLSGHPQIWMPPEKEAPFFSEDTLYEKGWEYYIADYFYNAPKDKLWGKSTPHYMVDMRVPSRLATLMPKLKLIAILRHPIKRAFSHYKMLARWETNIQTFDNIIHESLTDTAIESARQLKATPENEKRLIVTNGEYGRIIGEYLNYFQKDQILVVFTDDLKTNPELVLERIYRFLGISTYLPPSLGKIYHVGGTELRFPQIETLKKNAIIEKVWHFFPQRFRRNFMYWFNQWNVIPDRNSDSINTNDETIRLLKTHYIKDINLLESLIGFKTPWNDLKDIS